MPIIIRRRQAACEHPRRGQAGQRQSHAAACLLAWCRLQQDESASRDNLAGKGPTRHLGWNVWNA